MAKIKEAIQVMVDHADKITSILEDENEREFYFKYNDKYTWSITASPSESDFTVYYYPGGESPQEVRVHWDEVKSIRFTTIDESDPEILATFRALYSIVRNRLYDIDGILDAIITDS